MDLTLFTALVLPDYSNLGLYGGKVCKQVGTQWHDLGVDWEEYLRSRIAVSCKQIQASCLGPIQYDTVQDSSVLVRYLEPLIT